MPNGLRRFCLAHFHVLAAFPRVATAFTENFDSSNLLRFPLSFPAFFLIRIVMVRSNRPPPWARLALRLAVGIGIAAPGLFLGCAGRPGTFAALNILFARTIFSWVERWLAQRRTREILGVLFLLFMISFQLIGPMINRYGNHSHPEALQLHVGESFRCSACCLRASPPKRSRSVDRWDFKIGSLPLGCSAIRCCGFLAAESRLRAQYHGENLSEARDCCEFSRQQKTERLGWNLPGVPGSRHCDF